MKSIFNNVNINEPSLKGSYNDDDVVFLLKDISSLIKEKDTDYREKAIQSGTHYSEMLPVEYNPSDQYVDLFHSSLKAASNKLAVACGVVSNLILKKRGKDVVLVSLARAGTPVGILLKRYILHKYKLDLPHYSISIIRGKGIDENALKYIIKRHPSSELQFIDGWTGKGAIKMVLDKALDEFKEKYGINLNNDLGVLADPGYCSLTFGTREDFLIPSACLNSTVSGLVSRTVLRDDLIGPKDFHGAKYYGELKEKDLSKFFIDTIVKEFPNVEDEILRQTELMESSQQAVTWLGLKSIKEIQENFHIEDINLIKPGVGETTRVLLRRIPWKILVKDPQSPNLAHIMLLAKEKNVEVATYKDLIYECCGLIKPLKEVKE